MDQRSNHESGSSRASKCASCRFERWRTPQLWGRCLRLRSIRMLDLCRKACSQGRGHCCADFGEESATPGQRQGSPTWHWWFKACIFESMVEFEAIIAPWYQVVNSKDFTNPNEPTRIIKKHIKCSKLTRFALSWIDSWKHTRHGFRDRRHLSTYLDIPVHHHQFEWSFVSRTNIN